MMEEHARWQTVRPLHVPAQRVGRRRLLIGVGALSFGAFLAPVAGKQSVMAVAQPGGLPLGNWAGGVMVARARTWREPEPSEAAGSQNNAFTEMTSVLQLSGHIGLTVIEPAAGTAPSVTGMLNATWSLRTVKQFSDGRRTREESNGRLTGGEVVAEADVLTGDPRLILRGATWEPGAFPSLAIWIYGADGSPGPVGDGVVEARAADPLAMVVEWHTPDLIVGSVEADELRPPGPTAGPGARATDLRVVTTGRVTLLRTVRR
ncbi:MAG: hypothetical protein ACRDJ9_16800 [Dehalococcoidia bacterium]